MPQSPFRDRKLADELRRARAIEDERLRKEADAARTKEFLAWDAKRLTGGGFLFALLFGVVSLFSHLKEKEATEQDRRALAQAVAATKTTQVRVDQGGVHPSNPERADDVRRVVDRHADELGPCFDDGLASGALVLGKGASHAFAFSWTIEADGTTSSAKIETVDPREPTAVERCVTSKLGEWRYGEVGGKTDVIGWIFERCPTTREECVRPRR